MCLGLLLQSIVEVKVCWLNPFFVYCEEWPRPFHIGRQLLLSRVQNWGTLMVRVIWKWLKDHNKTLNCCRRVMMFSLLCLFSGGKEMSVSKCALTTACDWPNLRSSVLSVSLYITPQYANSAVAALAFPLPRVFKYVNLTSSVKDCDSTALLNCPKHSCHCRGWPLYCDNFHSRSGSFFLQVIASANCFINSPRVERKGRRCGMRCPPQHIKFGAVAPYVGGMTGVTKVVALHTLAEWSEWQR